jgi:hypothetical protein
LQAAIPHARDLHKVVSALQIEGMAAMWCVPCDHELRLPTLSSHQYINMTSTQTQTSVLMPSSHKSVSHHNQYRGILAMMEQLSVSQVKNTLGDHRFNANTGTDSQNIELLTANNRVCLYSFVLLQTNIFFCWQSMLILPHCLSAMPAKSSWWLSSKPVGMNTWVKPLCWSLMVEKKV